MSSNKLHPIYVALDAHQYSRAIKLALALPDSHVLGKALLAHAYSKSGQRYESLFVLQSIMGNGDSNRFCELQHEIQYSLQARAETSATVVTTTAAAAPDTASNKKGKKGKKGKPAPRPTPVVAAATTTTPKQKNWDWIEQLNTPPTLPEKWEELPPPETAITDEVSPFVLMNE
jgi:hypothetical protein